jgi:hypothetical protein
MMLLKVNEVVLLVHAFFDQVPLVVVVFLDVLVQFLLAVVAACPVCFLIRSKKNELK